MWSLLKIQEETGIALTESLTMEPPASVCGFFFHHPKSKYFSLGKIQKDQVEDYAQRKNQSLPDTEKWLSINLAYDRDEVDSKLGG